MKKLVIIGLILAICLALCACGGPKEVQNMEYTFAYDNTVLSGLFTGMAERKVPVGNGKFVASGGGQIFSFEGEWIDGSPIGVGHLFSDSYTIRLEDGTKLIGEYEGNVLNAVANGSGTFTATNSDGKSYIYTGEWTEGMPSGAGHLTTNTYAMSLDDGTELVGEYKGDTLNGIPGGNGTFVATTSNNESYKYTGEWIDGKPGGKGHLKTDIYTVYFKDGVIRTGKYEGDLLDGLASGHGTFSAINSAGEAYTYTGEWKNGLYNGQGETHFERDYYSYIGTYIDGDFAPTPADFFVSIGTYPEKEHDVNEKAFSFMTTHSQAFIENSYKGMEDLIDKEYTYKAFAKNHSNSGDKLIQVPYLNVLQIFEYDDWWGYDYTFILAYDGQYNYYYIRMLGTADKIYEGSRIKLTALPLDYMTYPNVGGGTTWAIACAAIAVE